MFADRPAEVGRDSGEVVTSIKFCRWALGTAQFGFPYGVANTAGAPCPRQVRAILKRGWQAGFRTLDTAMAYGRSEEQLGRAGVSSWEVITKLPGCPVQGSTAIAGWVEESLHGSLQRLRRSYVSGLLFHRPEELLGPHGKDLWKAAENQKACGHIKKIGVSVYDPQVLRALLRKCPLELVQFPLNPLDRRFLKGGLLGDLKKRKVEVHARSVFLQGLLLMPPSQTRPYFKKWRPLLRQWHEWACKKAKTPLRACVNFCEGLDLVDRFIVGVDSPTQLREILAALRLAKPEMSPVFGCEDPRILNPGQWFKA
ncbi:MAG: aldo/keto reductase [Bacteroidetes bacterium]|nr:aldo/keto reductase [Bacteroidota bacterium]